MRALRPWQAAALGSAATALAAVAIAGHAGRGGEADPGELLERLRESYPATRFVSVSETPIKGLFAVRMRRNTAYTDAEARRIILGGTMVDMREQSGLAAPPPGAGTGPAPAPFALPEGAAFRYDTSAPATATVTVFSDVDCPYCAELERRLADIGGLRVSVVLYPVAGLRPDSPERAAKVWCAHRPAGVYLAAMLEPSRREELLDGLDGGCDHPVGSNLALGRRLGIGATPTMAAPNGARLAGLRPARQVEAWIRSNQR